LIEAQRYPDDFDGIAAGAPALRFSAQNSFHHAWLAQTNTGPDGRAVLTATDMIPLHAAALKACDAADGLEDGQITNPASCRFDPASVLCKADYIPGTCLTAIQVAAARRIYSGAHTGDGKPLEVGGLMPGSELEWIGVFVPREPTGSINSVKFALDTTNHLLFTPNRTYTISDFPFTEAMYADEATARKLYDAADPDLAAFAQHGGRLVLYHGWSDPHISPLNTIEYYDNVGRAVGAARREEFARLFLFPGMGHCAGGDGPSQFPLLASLMSWVEQGVAPAVMVAHRPVSAVGPGQHQETPAGGPAPTAAAAARRDGPPPELLAEMRRKQEELAKLGPRQRPVYAYPAVAEYNGTGSVDEAANFHPAASKPLAIPSWIGAN
jgi:feruloyl esterase